MTPKPDDFDAVRLVVQTLEPFEEKDRLRIIRWACEKLNVSAPEILSPKNSASSTTSSDIPSHAHGPAHTKAKDINAFINEKAPKTDMQFAAVVAYYYRFEAPESERKESVSGPDLQDACRLSNRDRLGRPAQTLVNAFTAGYFDKSEHGKYRLNTVGENLVAMVLPASDSGKKQNARKPRKQKRVKKSGRR